MHWILIPDLDVTLHGWSKRDGTDTLHPVTVPEGVPLISDELQLINCYCQADHAEHNGVAAKTQALHAAHSVRAKERSRVKIYLRRPSKPMKWTDKLRW